jgi:hypothetical protein
MIDDTLKVIVIFFGMMLVMGGGCKVIAHLAAL